MAQRVGVVLAGGSGRRMGRTKGDLVVGGESFAQRAATALWPLCSSVLVSVGRAEDNPAPLHPVVEDALPGHGPLAGIDAAFRVTGSADLLVLACDYPRVQSDLLRQLAAADAADADLVMPTDPGGRDHPLVALWRRAAAAVVSEALEAGRLSVRGVLPDLRVRRLGPADFPGIDLGRALLNVNWPGDLERLDEAVSPGD